LARRLGGTWPEVPIYSLEAWDFRLPNLEAFGERNQFLKEEEFGAILELGIGGGIWETS